MSKQENLYFQAEKSCDVISGMEDTFNKTCPMAKFHCSNCCSSSTVDICCGQTDIHRERNNGSCVFSISLKKSLFTLDTDAAKTIDCAAKVKSVAHDWVVRQSTVRAVAIT